MMIAFRNTIIDKPNLSKFQSLVTKMAKKREPGIFENKYPEIDLEILRLFFKMTRESIEPEIKIFADYLDKIISKKRKFLDELFDYIDKNEHSKILLVLKNPITLESEFNAETLLLSSSLNVKYKDRVKLRYLKPHSDRPDLSNLFKGPPAFFAVTSDNMFRLEQSDGSSKISFNNEIVSCELSDVFSKLFLDEYSTVPAQYISEPEPNLIITLQDRNPEDVTTFPVGSFSSYR